MEKLELSKPRRAVEISNTISLVQRKAFNCLMMQAILVPKPKGQKYHRISIKELCHLTGYRQKDFFYLDKQLEEMQTTLVRWSGSNARDWGRVQFLGHVYYEEKTGMLEYSFSEKLIELVRQNRLYNRLDMGSMRELNSKHSLALYELCTGYRETDAYSKGTGWRLLPDIKHYLCGDRKAYPQFKIFNREVLKPAIKEVNESTDITVEMLTRRQGRSIHALRFLVKSNENYEGLLLQKPGLHCPPRFGQEIDEKQKASEKMWSSPDEMLDYFKSL